MECATCVDVTIFGVLVEVDVVTCWWPDLIMTEELKKKSR